MFKNIAKVAANIKAYLRDVWMVAARRRRRSRIDLKPWQIYPY